MHPQVNRGAGLQLHDWVDMPRTAATVLLVVAAGGLLGVAVSMIELARLGRGLPDQPLHARLNPFNHAGRPQPWTPAMRAANRQGLISGFLFLGAAAVFSALVFLAARP